MGEKGGVAAGGGGEDDVEQQQQQEDDGDGVQYCSEHPYAGGNTNNPGGICALCLQEKLGMLVSSSKSSPFFPLGGHPPPAAHSSSNSNSSSPPSFRSNTTTTTSSSYDMVRPISSSHRSRGIPKFPFLGSSSYHHKNKSKSNINKQHNTKSTTSSYSSATNPSSTASLGLGLGGLKRSKSVAPRPPSGNSTAPAPISEYSTSTSSTAAVVHPMDSPRKKSFWSFLYHSSTSSSSSSTSINNGGGGVSTARRRSVSASSPWSASSRGRDMGDTQMVSAASAVHQALEAVAEPDSPCSQSQASAGSSSFGRKVARSRSVGCGSRSFSGDFLERISNGFGDCTLRRVESHREPKPKMALGTHLDNGDYDVDDYEQQRRVKCAGFFGVPSSSSHWLSAEGANIAARVSTGGVPSSSRSHQRSWAWAFASPMRALRPATTTTYTTSTNSITAASPNNNNNNSNISVAALTMPSPVSSSAIGQHLPPATAAAAVATN